MSEWIRFSDVSDNFHRRKTKTIKCVSKCDGCIIGYIEWYSKWRHYCFLPIEGYQIVLSVRCLRYIAEKIDELENERKCK